MNREIIRNFIVFEGIDGSGTTTLQKRVSDRLSRCAVSHRLDAEPTNSAVGRRIRALLQTGNPADALFNTALSALFSLDRAVHLYASDGIKSAVADTTVLCDRYLFSTVAYQGLFGDFEEALAFNETFPLPEFLFFLDLPTTIALKRIENRGRQKEIYESAQLLENIAANYRKVIDRFRKTEMKIITLDATLAPEILEEEVLRSLESLTKGR